MTRPQIGKINMLSIISDELGRTIPWEISGTRDKRSRGRNLRGLSFPNARRKPMTDRSKNSGIKTESRGSDADRKSVV